MCFFFLLCFASSSFQLTRSDTDMSTESTRKQTRPTRARYLPPHMRPQNANAGGFPDTPTAEFTRPRFNSPLPARTTPRGRGRGRGPVSTNRRSPNWEYEKFDELEVIDGFTEERKETNLNAYEDIPVQASGDNIPPAVETFSEMDLGENLKQNIRRCKYLKPTPIQRNAIPIAVAGRDLMACAQTGSGKTAAFCFPIIRGVSKEKDLLLLTSRGAGEGTVACPLALILAPTRELSRQVIFSFTFSSFFLLGVGGILYYIILYFIIVWFCLLMVIRYSRRQRSLLIGLGLKSLLHMEGRLFPCRYSLAS